MTGQTIKPSEMDIEHLSLGKCEYEQFFKHVISYLAQHGNDWNATIDGAAFVEAAQHPSDPKLGRLSNNFCRNLIEDLITNEKLQLSYPHAHATTMARSDELQEATGFSLTQEGIDWMHERATARSQAALPQTAVTDRKPAGPLVLNAGVHIQ